MWVGLTRMKLYALYQEIGPNRTPHLHANFIAENMTEALIRLNATVNERESVTVTSCYLNHDLGSSVKVLLTEIPLASNTTILDLKLR